MFISKRAATAPQLRSTGAGVLLPASLLVFLIAVLSVAPAHGHVELEASRPGDGDTVEAPLEEVWLEFSAAVPLAYTSATLVGPDGRVIDTPDLQVVPETGRREFVLPIDQRLPGGAYTVNWRTMAADGHVIEDSFSFTLEVEEEVSEPPEPVAPEEEEPAPHAHHPEDVAGPSLLAPSAPLSVTIRFLHYLALLTLLGGVAFHYGVMGRMRRDERVAGLVGEAGERNVRVMSAAFLLLAVVVPARLWVQSARVHGMSDALDPGNLSTMLTLTTWGQGWLLQVAGAIVFLVGLLLIRPAGKTAAGWMLAAGGVLALSFVPALSGHAAAVEEQTVLAITTHALHVIGGGVWIGTLAVLLLVGLPSALSSRRGERIAATAATVSLFSPVALGGAALAGLTGIANALFHFSALSEVWTTGYGTALLLKLAVLAVALAMGFYHWRFVLPGLQEGESPRRFQLTAGAELAFGVAVLLVTAVFVVLPTPG